MVEVLMGRNRLAEQLGPEPGMGREDLGLHQPGAGLSGQARFLRNHPVLGARGRPAWLRPPRGAAWTPARAARARVTGRRRRSRRDATRP